MTLYDQLIAARDAHAAAVAEVQKETDLLDVARRTLENAETGRAIIQTVAASIQQEVHNRIAGVVSRCLQTVFGKDAYQFSLTFEQKRGRTEALMGFVRGDLRLAPTEGAGGGTVDVAAFALRLSCLMLHRPPLRRVVIADEPFRFVSAMYRPALRALLLELAEELDIQFILVTHDPAFIVGNVIEVEKL